MDVFEAVPASRLPGGSGWDLPWHGKLLNCPGIRDSGWVRVRLPVAWRQGWWDGQGPGGEGLLLLDSADHPAPPGRGSDGLSVSRWSGRGEVRGQLQPGVLMSNMYQMGGNGQIQNGSHVYIGASPVTDR